MKTENSFLLIHLYFDDIQRSSSGTTFYKYINIYIYIYIYIYSKKHSPSHEDSETAFSTPSTVKSVFIARIRVFYFLFFYFAIHTTNKAVLIFRAWIPLRLASPTELF